MSCFSAPAIPRARSSRRRSCERTEGGRFNAFSAGSQPKGEVNPFALKVLASYAYPTDGMRSKSWEEFAVAGAPEMDFVFTVCDNAAGESLPGLAGPADDGALGHRGPGRRRGHGHRKGAAFVTAFSYLKNRISVFTSLPLASIDKMALGTKLREIGRMDGATASPAKAG